MEGSQLLFELLVVLVVAAFGAALFERARLPAIAGFLIVGALVGPGGLGLVGDVEAVRTVAAYGVVFLLFEIALELPFEALRRLWRPAFSGGALQVGITLAGVAAAAVALGAPPGVAFLVGGLVSISSTAVLMPVLAARGEVDAPHGRLAFAISLFQDLCTIPLLLAIPILSGALPLSLSALAATLGKLSLALALLYGVARFAFPWLAERAVRLRSRDLFSLMAFALALGSAVAAESLGLTLAIGAFTAGLVFNSSPWAHQLLAEVAPLRGVLLGLFFTAVGMLFDPLVVIDAWRETAAFVLAVVVWKSVVIVGVVVFALRFDVRVALLTALGLAQTGEFAFVVAEAARLAGVLDARLHQVFVASSILTLVASPFLVSAAPALASLVTGRAERLRPARATQGAGQRAPQAVVVGAGLTGRTLARALRASRIPYVVMESNPRAVEEGLRAGEPVVYGDATRPSVQRAAGVAGARVVAIAISDPAATRRAVAVARSCAPQAHIIARTRYVAEVDELQRLGASTVVAEELEATLDLLSTALQRLDVPSAIVARFAEELRAEGYALLRGPGHLLLDPWLTDALEEGAPSWVEVPPGPAAGRSIAELDLRARTGASVVAHERAGGVRTNPPADLRLEAGDRLLVLAGADAAARLQRLLTEGA